ncbi:MAG: hypothetical protein GY807_04510 [Gammaproteobacteria bacterium]|nr:hypothetical protein [Gammaproteobacteria bacterium]
MLARVGPKGARIKTTSLLSHAILEAAAIRLGEVRRTDNAWMSPSAKPCVDPELPKTRVVKAR